jgi:hypothetical protein
MKMIEQLIAAIFAGLHSSGCADWQAITEDRPVKRKNEIFTYSSLPAQEYDSDKAPITELNKHDKLNKWKQPAKCRN